MPEGTIAAGTFIATFKLVHEGGNRTHGIVTLQLNSPELGIWEWELADLANHAEKAFLAGFKARAASNV